MEKRIDDRKFKFWFYHVTHGEAIIRSMKTEEDGTNIDIYFGDIQYIEMPTILSELKLINANAADIVYLTEKTGKSVRPQNVIVLLLGERRFYIIASIVKVMENSLETNELPIMTFMKGIESL